MTVQDWGLLVNKVKHAVALVLSYTEADLTNDSIRARVKADMAKVQDTWFEYGTALGYTGSRDTVIDKAKKHWFTGRAN